MAQSEERPSKIRKLDSGTEDDQEPEFASPLDAGSLKGSQGDPVFLTENDADEAVALASKEDIIAPSFHNGEGDLHFIKSSQHLSKNQLKKLIKKKNWEEGRDYRKAKRREKTKQKKVRKAEARATLLSPQNAEDAPPIPPRHPKRSSQRPMQLPITLVLDCDFDDLMTEAELISLGAQLTRCYSDNKTAPYRVHLVVSSFGGKLKHRFETLLTGNHLGWKGVKFTAADFVVAATEAGTMMRGSQGGQLVGAFGSMKNDAVSSRRSTNRDTGASQAPEVTSLGAPVPRSAAGEATFVSSQPPSNGTAAVSRAQLDPAIGRAATGYIGHMACDALPEDPTTGSMNQESDLWSQPSVVYLTSDSPHTLDVLSPYTSYVIGGIVDKNRHKGICYKRARGRDIPTARLPIGEFMTMQSRTVLTTNHVAEIMLRWLEHADWAKAFLQVIPKRKEARLKIKQETADDLGKEEDGNTSGTSQGD